MPLTRATKDNISPARPFTEWIERQAERAGVDIYRTAAYFKIEPGGALMPLSVENIGFGRVAVSQTWLQNGDVMFDPEIQFAVGKRDKRAWVPFSYRQDGVCPEMVYAELDLRGNVLRLDVGRVAGLRRFCNGLWLRNLRYRHGDAPITRTCPGN